MTSERSMSELEPEKCEFAASAQETEQRTVDTAAQPLSVL